MSLKPEADVVEKFFAGVPYSELTGAQSYRERVYRFWASGVNVVEYEPDTGREPLQVEEWGEVATENVLQIAPKSETDFDHIDPAKLVADDGVGLTLVRAKEYERVFGANIELKDSWGVNKSYILELTEGNQTVSVKFELETGYVPKTVRRLVGMFLIASPKMRQTMMEKGVILVKAADSGESVMAPRGKYNLLTAWQVENRQFVELADKPDGFAPAVFDIEHASTAV